MIYRTCDQFKAVISHNSQNVVRSSARNHRINTQTFWKFDIWSKLSNISLKTRKVFQFFLQLKLSFIYIESFAKSNNDSNLTESEFYPPPCQFFSGLSMFSLIGDSSGQRKLFWGFFHGRKFRKPWCKITYDLASCCSPSYCHISLYPKRQYQLLMIIVGVDVIPYTCHVHFEDQFLCTNRHVLHTYHQVHCVLQHVIPYTVNPYCGTGSL